VGGIGLARGYWGAPELTAAAFVPDPFGPAGSRLYRTGDLVRRTADGDLVYVGRRDNQLKIRGFRVEAGEVESVLVRHPDVVDAAVLTHRPDGQEARLLAVVVLTPSARAVADRGHGQQRWQGRSLHRELSEHTASALPAHMMPARYVSTPQLPLTPHGKVDRAALLELALAPEEPEQAPAEEALTASEQAVAGIWARHLGLERVTREDHFLEVGGHSLVAVQVIAEVREHFQVDMAVGTLFASPVLADFAAAVDALTGS